MKYITVNGNELPFSFGMKALSVFASKNGVSFDNAINDGNVFKQLDMLVPAVTIALNDGARKTGISTRYKDEDIWDMLDNEPNLLVKMTELITSSISAFTDKLGN